MKKYLMIGFAALAFASCSHDVDTYTPAEVAKADYDAKFISEFGQPGAQQDWGFGASTRAFTRTWNVNGNQWHKELNLEYDAPVTTEEKNMVFNYVNDVNHVETVDQISFTKYWVAQIWNGNTDQNADGVKAPVSHSYPNQTGAITDIIGGAQMDKLEILEKAGTWTHCNNFNHADNNDWIEPENGGVEGRTLMEESGTLSFRYTNSQGSYLSEKYIIVPGEKIHSSLKGRYYVCFDFEKGYTDAEKAEEKTFFSFIAKDNNGALQAEQTVSLPGYYTSANMPTDQQILDAFGNPNYKEISSISIKGYLNGDKHCDGDDNYTDWIVRISPAKVKGRTYTGRIMAEDLTIQSSSDWDFNDVVFDFAFENGTAYIQLQAAGGTLPLSIGGSLNSDNTPILDEAGNVANSYEVHEMFDLTTTKTMVNTGAGVEREPVSFELTDKGYTQASDILICVKKKVNGVEEWIPITAYQGQPAAKFVTYPTVDWVDEYAHIKGAYGDFKDYVEYGSGYFNPDPTEKNDLYFDRITRNEPAITE